MDRRRFFMNKNLNERLSSNNHSNTNLLEDTFAELNNIYEDLQQDSNENVVLKTDETMLQAELEEGIFDSKEAKQAQYAEAIQEKTKKNVQNLGIDVAKEIATALSDLAYELTDDRDNGGVTDNRGGSDGVASEIYHFVEELKAKYAKKKEDGKSTSTEIIWDVIDFLNKYKIRAKGVSEHVKTLKGLDDFIGTIVEIPKIGSKALIYAKLIINKSVLDRLNATQSSLKKEFRIKV